MGCAPPEKRHQSIPGINAVPKKTAHLSPRQSQKSKNSTQTNQNNMLNAPLVPKIPSNQSLQSQRRNKKGGNVPNLPILKKSQSLKSTQRFSYEHRESPQKPMEKEVIRIMSPRDKPKSPKKAEPQEASKLMAVHSLDIVSRIKTPKEDRSENKKEGERRSEAKSSKVQQVNITFNCNDFAVAQSKTKVSNSRKGWRQQALINELKGINNQNFKRIAVNSRNFQ